METKLTFLSELKGLREAANGFGTDTIPSVIYAQIGLKDFLVLHAEAIEELVTAAEFTVLTGEGLTELDNALAKLEKP